MKESFIDTICTHLKAGTAAIYINTDETNRVIHEIKRAGWKTGNGKKIVLDNEKQITEIFKRYKSDIIIKNGSFVLNYEKLCDILTKIDKLLISSNDINTLNDDAAAITHILNSVYDVISWNIIDGFSVDGKFAGDDLVEALKATKATGDGYPKNCIFVFRDCHAYFNTESTTIVREILRNLTEDNLLNSHADVSHHLIFVQPDWVPHRDIQSCLSMVEFSLPDEEHLDSEITYIQQSIDDVTKRDCDPILRSDLCRAMRGFTQQEAANAMSYTVAKHGGFVPEAVSTIINLQKNVFNKNGILTLVDYDSLPDINDVGGFDNYFSFIDECITCFSPEAIKAGLKKPKGVNIVGIPGSGKSIVAKMTARKMKLPLIIYDFASQMGSLVGETEKNQRMVLKQITAKGPCVLMLDEADKLFNNANSSQGDSGVGMRAFGKLLTWMAENQDAFIIMTMNRVVGIPPELLRAGRLDAIFYTTFPTNRERQDIINIHLRKNGAKLESDLAGCIAKKTEKYVGSELEQLVIKAIRTSFKTRQSLDPTLEELEASARVITPVATLDKENIEAIERFCKDTAIPVSSPTIESKIVKAARNIKIGPSNN